VRRASKPLTLTSLLLGALKLAVIVALPLVAGIRSAVYFYLHGASTWIAMGLAALVELAVVATYAAAISFRLTGRARFAELMKWLAAPLVVAWCAYGLLYLSRANAKTDAVRQSYRSVHPILRLAIATDILANDQLVVTDMIREPADYARMGLPVFDRTMHYRQSDGWVHAVDLRTTGHGEIRNRALQLYFWSMGFSTLRHVGTADHLHVQLPLAKR